MDNKELQIVELAEKGGDNADLLLLDRIHEVDYKINQTKEEIEKAHEAIEQKLDSTLEGIKQNTPNLNKVLESVRGTEGQKGEKGDVGEIGDEGIPGINGIDGKDGENGRDGIDGENGIDGKNGLNGKDGKDGSPDTPEQVRDKLETLKGEERLDKSAIKGLDEELKKAGSGTAFSVFGAARNSVEYTDLSAQLNGVLTTFTVPRRRFIMVLASFAPYVLRPEVDYTGSGTYTLTITNEIPAGRLATGQTLLLLHSRL